MKPHISFVQSVMILMLSTGLLNHVIIIPILLDAADRDAWMSVLLAAACSLAWIAILHFGISKIGKQPIFEMLSKAYHPFVVRLLTGAAGIYLFAICTTPSTGFT